MLHALGPPPEAANTRSSSRATVTREGTTGLDPVAAWRAAKHERAQQMRVSPQFSRHVSRVQACGAAHRMWIE
jgi:hypothetical protein